ncbi:MAG: chemotaxis protein CheW [Rhodocyclaceae bacterium]|nr:chemotaxis protein CheW [Rhodocyclaceae bacterium]
MALDMSQFYQVFFEETAEHLANLESLLLEVDRENPDPEQLNAIFRAAHSIKGSSGTFGFNDMMDVTHVLETLLDRIRKGERALTEEMVDAFLEARDILGGLLAAHQGEGEGDMVAANAVCDRLRRLTADDSPVEAPQVAAPPAAASAAADRPEDNPVRYEIRFVPVAGLPESSMDSMLRELGVFGEVEVIQRPRERGDAWILRLLATAQPEVLRDVVDYVAEADSIVLSSAGPAGDDAGGAYGFFREAGAGPAAAQETAYGLFEDAPAQPASEPWGLFSREEAASDDSYGFFEPLSELPPLVKNEARTDEAYGLFEESTPQASGPASDPGGAYGFFVQPDAPAAATVEAEPAAEAIPAPDPKGAYGFFRAVPRPVEPASAPASAPESSAPPAPKVEAKPAAPSAPLAVVPAAEKAKPAAKPAAAKPAADAGTIRVGVEKVDQMINLVGELVITQAMLAQAASKVDPAQFERLMNGLAQLERNTRDLQESVMSIRMMPISVVFSRFPRVVRDLSQKLGKQVELKLSGENTELDKTLIERISDPLTHLIRNSLDHGIETTEARLEKGKPAVGTITLSASHQSGNIVIEVGDDGAGLNRERILSKAKSRGLPVHDGMSDQEVWLLIFEAGFSTADQVTEVSGRGVGMDVVKRNISAMGGRVEIQSVGGVGTRMTVRLPLTLAILDGMSVAVGQENYIIPLNYVIESLQPKKSMIKTVSGVQRLIQVRGEYLPVVALYEAFGIEEHTEEIENSIMVVLEADGTKAALLVDALVGQHQVVIKSLEANYRKVPGISGATIMGDGHVALILDVAALVGMARHALPVAA